MIGTFVMTENELQKRKPTPEPVGMGSYTIDSHNVQRYITPEGYVQNEGDIGVRVEGGPYQIAYGSLVPKRGEAANLLVPVCRLQLAHRLRQHPHGAGLHDPRPERRHRRRDGHRRQARRAGRALSRAARAPAEGRSGAGIHEADRPPRQPGSSAEVR